MQSDELDKAARIVERLQSHLASKNNSKYDAKLQAMLDVFENPVLKKIFQLQKSIHQLKEEVKKDDFDADAVTFSNENGSLIVDGREVPVGSVLDENDIIDLRKFIETAAQGRDTEEVDLYKYENEGLGFSVVGLRSENRGDLGIFVQDIKPGGMASRDGRLQESDQILVINNQPLVPTISHQEAIRILQQVKGLVKLIVARGGIPQAPGGLSRQASISSSNLSSLSHITEDSDKTKWSHVETIDLENDGRGLGFGIVGGQATGGVIVKTIVPGGVADRDGRLKSGDHILSIGGNDLTNLSSEDVANVLRQCGTLVKMTIARCQNEEVNNDPLTSTNDDDLNSVASSSQSSTSSFEDQVTDLNTFDVELVKDSKGLGITIGGFLPEDKGDNDGRSGIFVKDIASKSAADIDGRIRPGDQIIAVDGHRLDTPNVSSQEAVDALRSTGVVVKLTVARPDVPQISDESSVESDAESVELRLDAAEERRILQNWQIVMGPAYEIVIACLRKYSSNSGLGISLEGTVDYSDMPHHYLRSILPEGPVGSNGILNVGDELLEVNGDALRGLNHHEVVVILKNLPLEVCMVCARIIQDRDSVRNTIRDSVVLEERDGEFLELKPNFHLLGSSESFRSNSTSLSQDTISRIQLPDMPPVQDFAIDQPQQDGDDSSTSSESIAIESDDDSNAESATHQNDGAWESQITTVNLVKSNKGMGFSILDYQDPVDESKTAILVRSLVPDGVAEEDGRLQPGDRLITVNDKNLEFSTLDEAVTILKSVPQGLVTIGVRKPKPSMFSLPEISDDENEHPNDDDKSATEEIETPQHFEEPNEVIAVESSSSSESSSDEDVPETAIQTVESITVNNQQQLDPRPTLLVSKPVIETAVEDDASSQHSSSSSSSESSAVSLVKEAKSPTLSPSSTLKGPYEVKQVQMGGMTAITVTGPVMSQRKLSESSSNSDAVSLPPVVPPKPANYSAPSWQNAVKTHVQPPVDGFERIVQLSKGKLSLGITVSPDKEGDGLIVRSVIVGGAVHRAGEPKIDDMIRRVNNDSAVGLGAQQARSLILNHSKFSPDVKITYIPKRFINAFKNGLPYSDLDDEPEQKLPTPKTPRRPDDFTAIKSFFEVETPKQNLNAAPKVNNPISPVSLNMWGSIKKVDITRNPNQSLGISIVGGKDVQQGNLSGVFFKEVLPDGPVGIDGRMHAGDRILKVDNTDLALATHATAVEAIQKAGTHVSFIIQCFVGKSEDLTKSEEPVQPEIVPVQAAEIKQAPVKKSPGINLDAYKHLNGDVFSVELEKGTSGLGISLAGNEDESGSKVYVVAVNPAGVAGMDGRLNVGDEILEVNGHSLNVPGCQDLASNIIRNTSGKTVNFVVYREKIDDETPEFTYPPQLPESNDEQSNVRVVKLVKDFQGLGFAISESPQGITVQSIAQGGTAYRDGRLQKGDFILSVDDKSLSGVSYETAIAILKQTRGTVKLTVTSQPSSSSVNTGSISSPSSIRSRSLSRGSEVVHEENGSDPLTCPIIPGQETLIEINKENAGLGVSIVGGSDSLLNSILVHTVYEDGAAARDGRIWPGDRIMFVNNYDLRHASHDEAINVLRNTPETVQLIIHRDDNRENGGNDEKDVYDVHNVWLRRSHGKSLGLNIVGKKNGPGVFISNVTPNGLADKEGTIKPGDQILSINDVDVRQSGQDVAVQMLKSASSPDINLVVGRLKAGTSPSDFGRLSKQSSLDSNSDKPLFTPEERQAQRIRFVEIEKSPTQPLGVSIAGGVGSPLGDVPIFVAVVQNNAAATGKLEVGDQIISINGQSTDNKSHDEVVHMLKGSADAIVLMQVRDGNEKIKELTDFLKEASTAAVEAVMDMNISTPLDDIIGNQNTNSTAHPIEIDLLRGADGLGFSIVGGYGSTHGNLPIYVKSVSQVGAAVEDGRLKRGDRILSVNGESLEGYTHEEAAEALRRRNTMIRLCVIPA